MPPARGWPISQYILKVHSRCDLACDHCYVYEHSDQSWRGRPRAMAVGTVRAAADRIAEHAAAHHLPRVSVVLHGGEPLLLGPRLLAETLRILRGRIEPETRLDLGMQSNGIQLSEEFAELLVEYDVKVGISLDGGAAANDLHRRFANGASSHARVLDALQLLRRPEYRSQYSGILCTIDLRNDPVAVYEALREQQPPRLDLLLPHATWEQPPVRPDGIPTPYADWLLAVHERWRADGRPMSIRIFDSIRSTGAGGPSGNEWLGLDRADLVVLETDGTWEKIDTLKTAYDGAPATGLNVFEHPVARVAELPDVVRRQVGLDGLARACQECPIVRQCGGGLYAHRYRPDRGFDNPSVYCADLMELIVSLNERSTTEVALEPGQPVDAGLPIELIDQLGAGRADAETLRFLADKQLSFTRALLAVIADAGSPTVKSAWAVLAELDEQAPDAVAAILAHPYIRVWAIEALRKGELDGSAGDYLACVAAAAASRAGSEVGLDVPVRGNAIHLPSLGSLVLPQAGPRIVRLEVGPDGHHVRDAGEVRWLPSRYVPFGENQLLLEDLDPFRDCHDWKAAERLSATEAREWQASLGRAWHALQSDAPDHVGAIAAGLRAVVPLVTDPAGMMRSSTARQAFGSIAMATSDEESMVVLLAHEFQHNVLGALLDVCDLYDPGHLGRIKVAWRTDPRPVEGVLQGAYAHLAIADIWRRRAEQGGSDGTPREQFRQIWSWTAEAVDELLRSGALTPIGERFVSRMAETLAGSPA